LEILHNVAVGREGKQEQEPLTPLAFGSARTLTSWDGGWILQPNRISVMEADPAFVVSYGGSLKSLDI
jgi:hypothetical protein